jgi:hypothetical protein
MSLFGYRSIVPDWANFMPLEEFRAFFRQLEDELVTRRIGHEIDANAGAVRLAQTTDAGGYFDLQNLAQICHGSQQPEWPKIIREYFDRLFQAQTTHRAPLERFADDFSEARGLLKVRLYPSSMDAVHLLVGHQPMEAVVAALTYDLPETVASVPHSHVTGWGVPLPELFDIGLANVQEQDPISPAVVDLDAGVSLSILNGESYFTATHSLFLGDYLDPTVMHGAIFAVPHRQAVIFYPIVDSGALRAIYAIIAIAQGMYKDGPGSISPELYWWRGEGRVDLLPTQATKNSLEFVPPPDFVELMNGNFT